MASSIKGFASSNAIKVWKVKKKKLKEKLGTVIKEENEVRTMLQHYVEQSRQRVKELCSKEDIVVFNQEYEDVSSSLDMCINELFEFGMAIKLRLDNVNSDSESLSSDEGSFKSIESRTASAGTLTGRESGILEVDDGMCKSITHSTPLQDNCKIATGYCETMEKQPELLDKEHRISVTKTDNFHGTPPKNDSLLPQLQSELPRQYQQYTTTGIENFHGDSTSINSLVHHKQSLIPSVDGVVPAPLLGPKLKNITTENFEGLRSTNSLSHREQSPILCEAGPIQDQQHDVRDISTTNSSDGQNMNDHSLSPELKITPETFRRGLDGIVNAFMEDPSRESLTSDVQEESIEHKPKSSFCLNVPNLPSLPNKADPKILDSNQSEELTLFNNNLKPHLVAKSDSPFETKSAAEDPISDLSSTYAPASNEILYHSRIIHTSVEKSDLTAHDGHVGDNEDSFGVSTREFTDLSSSKTTTNHESAIPTSIPNLDQYKNNLSTLNPEAPMFKIPHQTLNNGQVPLNVRNPKDIQSELTMQEILQQSPKPYLSFPVKVTHINELDDFYVSLNPEGTTALLTHLSDYFKKRKDTLHPASLLEVNNLYMASISATNVIRCRLLGCIENVYTVQNLDVGDVIQVKKSALYDLPVHIKWPYVFQCALHQHNLITQWQSPGILKKFKELCMMQSIFAIFRHEQEQKTFLDLNFKYNDSEISIQEYFYELCSTENSTKNSCDEGKKIAGSTTEKPHVPRKDVDTNSSSGRSTPEHSFDWKASIKIPYCPDIKDGSFERITCLVSFVDSPSNFYVQLALNESGATMLDDQLSKMNRFYSTLKLKEPVYKKVAVQPKSFWCCQNPGAQDSFWYRVKILSFVEDVCSSSDASNAAKVGTRKKKHRSMNPTTMLQALCVDFGDTITVMLKDLFPLAKQFLELPALAVQCSLARIEPVNELLDWPAETTLKFIEFAPLEQAREVEILEITGPGSYIVDLFNEDGITASDFLVKENLAIVTETDPDVSKFEKFNPMEEEFQSGRNNLTVDVDDACVAVTGHKPKDESYICQRFQNRGFCPNKRSCNYLHIKGNSTWTRDQETIPCDIKIVMPNASARVIVEITFVFSPSHFYIKCPYGFTDAVEFTNSLKTSNGKRGPGNHSPLEVLEELEEQMSDHYGKKSSFFDNLSSDLAIGSVVACRYRETQNWYRAKVMAHNDDEEVQVFYVDYGNLEWIPRVLVREILPQFLFLPQQAIECYLSNICPTNSSSWSPEASDFFASQTLGKVMVAKVTRIVGYCAYIDLYTMEGGDQIWLNNILVTKGFAEKCQPRMRIQSQSENESCYSSTDDLSQKIQYFPG